MKNRNSRQPEGGPTLSRGLWGGEHIRLEVDEAGARFEFDCAHSTVSTPIVLDARNQFYAEGVYVRESGGPERPGQRPDSHPVRYTGRVEGERMTVNVTLTDVSQNIGAFTLTRGAEPSLVKCL